MSMIIESVSGSSIVQVDGELRSSSVSGNNVQDGSAGQRLDGWSHQGFDQFVTGIGKVVQRSAELQALGLVLSSTGQQECSTPILSCDGKITLPVAD